jgi:type IV fimbrial biogenesis protein FimT
MAVTAILSALALPDLRRLVADASVRSAADQTLAALQLARRTALATGTNVTLCPTRNERDCDMQGTMWMLFANRQPGHESHRDDNEPLLRIWPQPRGVSVSGTRGYAAYLPQPRAAATLTFTFCHTGNPALRRSVVVSQTGRPRISFPDPASISSHPACP